MTSHFLHTFIARKLDNLKIWRLRKHLDDGGGGSYLKIGIMNVSYRDVPEIIFLYLESESRDDAVTVNSVSF